MKKLKYLLLVTPLFLVGCFSPPIPDIEVTIQNADPNIIVELPNEITDFYFRTALPFQPSPSRGLIYNYIINRADIGQVEMSLMRIATDYFDPEIFFVREGQQLTRDFTADLLRHHNLEPEFSFESARGLNPPLGASFTFGNFSATNTEGSLVRPLSYILEQNFVTISDNNEFQLEGVAIAIALNPYYNEIDRNIGLHLQHRMSDDDIVNIGKDIASELLSHLRIQEALAEVPILIGLYILKTDQDVIPGHFASVAYVEESRTSISSWTPINERHFSLPDPTNTIHSYTNDVNISDQYLAFRESIENYFPHRNGIVARAHFVDRNLYRLSINFNMSFLGATEKISFFQHLEESVLIFSEEYDIRITVQDLRSQLGSLRRPPGGEIKISLFDW